MAADLNASIEALTESQRLVLGGIVDAMKAGCNVRVNPDSDLCEEPEFSDYFANLFCIYHAITEHKFEKKSFEFAFKYACIASGWKSEINRNSSHQGEDVTRGGERFSLKTEGENSKTSFKISKFSEARFIANYKTEIEEREISSVADNDLRSKKLHILKDKREKELLPSLVKDFKSTVRHHLSCYDRVLGLKANVIEDEGLISFYHYRLIEIPKSLLERVLDLGVEDFRELRGNGGTSASVICNGKRAFGVTLDGSVEKITFTGINISECITHASFKVSVAVNGSKSHS